MVDEAPARRPAAPTLELVAAAAGVSRGTASRVLSGSPQVSERAKTAVLAAAERLGYVPNLAARALVTKRSESVAFVVAETEERFFADPFFATVLRGAHTTVSQHRRQLIFVVLASAEGRGRFARFAGGGHIDAALFVSLHGPDQLSTELAARGVPVVTMGRPYRVGDDTPYGEQRTAYRRSCQHHRNREERGTQPTPSLHEPHSRRPPSPAGGNHLPLLPGSLLA